MVFGIQELRNQLEAVTEERNFFQSKYLEQVSLLQDLHNELKKSKREINRLREELMARQPRQNTTSLLDQVRRSAIREDTTAAVSTVNEEKKDDDGDGDHPPLTATAADSHSIPNSPSGLTTCEDEKGSMAAEDDEEEEVLDIDENEAIRESASKLLQWANYRQTWTSSSLEPPNEE